MRDLAVREPSLRALEEALGCSNLFEWLEEEARSLAKLGTKDGHVHFTPELLRSRGVRALLRENAKALVQDAVVEFEGNGYVIRYAATRPDRIRFSIAHEIGHTYLADAYGRRVARIEYQIDPTVESLCNFFARALLLPRDRMFDYLRRSVGRRSTPALHLVPQLASAFRVSEQVAARRVVFDLFGGFVAAACITDHGRGEGWRTTWCAPSGEHDLPKSSGWRVPLRSNGRLVPNDMVPDCAQGQTTVTSVDGRWAELSRPKTTAQCRARFASVRATGRVDAVVATVTEERRLFDEPSQKCFVALLEEQQLPPPG